MPHVPHLPPLALLLQARNIGTFIIFEARHKAAECGNNSSSSEAAAAADVAGSRGKFLSHVTSPRSARPATDDDGDGDDVPCSPPPPLAAAAAVQDVEASGIFTTGIFRILLKSSLRHPENSDAE